MPSIQNEPSSMCKIVHEQQSRMLCGKHMLNNLFQLEGDQAFTVEYLDSFADTMHKQEAELFSEQDGNNKKICIPNNHKSKYWFWSWGNYSFEVINEALKSKQCHMLPMKISADNVEQEPEITVLDDQAVVGLIINVQFFSEGYFSTSSVTSFLSSIFACRGSQREQPQQKEVIKRNVGGHWFAIGKVYFGDNQFQWFNHDSKLTHAQPFENTAKVYDYVYSLSKLNQVHSWVVQKIGIENDNLQ